MTGLTEALAEFIQAETLQGLPPDAPDKAKKAIADTFAVILAAAGSEVAPPPLRYVERTGGSGASPILGSGRAASPLMAALVNGTFGHALDLDDVLSMIPAHPSPCCYAAHQGRAGAHHLGAAGNLRGRRRGRGAAALRP